MDLYFQHGCKICQIFNATLCSGSIEFVFVDCASIFVSGARPWSHNITEYQYVRCMNWWNVKYGGYWNVVVFLFLLFTFLQRTQRHSEIWKTPGKTCWHMGFVTQTTARRRGKCLFQLVLLLLGHWFGSSGRKELVEPPTVLLVPICGDVQLWLNIPLQLKSDNTGMTTGSCKPGAFHKTAPWKS